MKFNREKGVVSDGKSGVDLSYLQGFQGIYAFPFAFWMESM